MYKLNAGLRSIIERMQFTAYSLADQVIKVFFTCTPQNFTYPIYLPPAVLGVLHVYLTSQ